MLDAVRTVAFIGEEAHVVTDELTGTLLVEATKPARDFCSGS